MIELVSTNWLDESSAKPNVRIVDARPTVRYLAGHIVGAVNFPSSRLFDAKSLELRNVDALADAFGAVGIDNDSSVVLCDSFDGQNSAMVAWALEYLGLERVRILSSYVESWTREGRELFYRPVKVTSAEFRATPHPFVRATLDQIKEKDDKKLVDFRSAKEFSGELAAELRAGHIPDAVNLPWTELLGQGYEFLRSKTELANRIENAGLERDDKIVAYCNYGPRAALGFVALKQLGYEKVMVFDGSFHQWALHSELPVEIEKLTEKTQTGKWEAYTLPGC